MPVTIDFDRLNYHWAKETVTLVKVAPDGAEEAEYASVTAVGSYVPDELADSGGVQHARRQARWDVRASTLAAGVVVQRGDRIVSTSAAMAGTYAVEEAKLVSRGTRWECVTVKMYVPI